MENAQQNSWGEKKNTHRFKVEREKRMIKYCTSNADIPYSEDLSTSLGQCTDCFNFTFYLASDATSIPQNGRK